MGKLHVPITNAGSQSIPQSLLRPPGPDNEYLPQGTLSLSKVRQHGGLNVCVHVHTQAPQFKTYHAICCEYPVIKLSFLILIEQPPWHIASPECPAGSRMMNLPQTLSPSAGWQLGCQSNWIWGAGVARLVSSQELSLHPPLEPVASFWMNFRAQIKDLVFQETFHGPSQLLLIFSRSWFNQHFTQEGFPGPHANRDFPPAITWASPCVTASQDLPPPDFMLLIYLYRFVSRPPHRNCVFIPPGQQPPQAWATDTAGN